MSDYGGTAPPRHLTNPARPRPQRAPTDTRTGGTLTRAGVEQVIVALNDAMESAVDEYADLCDSSAEAEADWKLALNTAQLQVDAGPEPPEVAALRDPNVVYRPKDAKTREAAAMAIARSTVVAVDVTGDPDARDLYRTHLIMDRRLSARREALHSLQRRLDAYRTLAANIRAQV